MLLQALSVFGAVLVLTAFAAHQTHRMRSGTIVYQSLNCAGGLFLTIVAVVEKQYGFILMEGSWALLSAWGLFKVLTDPATWRGPE